MEKSSNPVCLRFRMRWWMRWLVMPALRVIGATGLARAEWFTVGPVMDFLVAHAFEIEVVA